MLFVRFLHYKWNCETSLIATGCGEDVAHFYSAISRLRMKKDHNCQPRPAYAEYLPPRKTQAPSDMLDQCFSCKWFSSAAFEYSLDCPHDMEKEVEECVKKHPEEDILTFRNNENDLIADGTRKDIKKSCS